MFCLFQSGSHSLRMPGGEPRGGAQAGRRGHFALLGVFPSPHGKGLLWAVGLRILNLGQMHMCGVTHWLFLDLQKDPGGSDLPWRCPQAWLWLWEETPGAGEPGALGRGQERLQSPLLLWDLNPDSPHLSHSRGSSPSSLAFDLRWTQACLTSLHLEVGGRTRVRREAALVSSEKSLGIGKP